MPEEINAFADVMPQATPEVTEIEVVEIQPQPDVPADESEEEGGEAPRPKKGFAKKLERKDAEIAQKNAELAAERERLAKLEAEYNKLKPQPKDDEPNPADFVNTLDYLRACQKYDAKVTAKAELEAFKAEQLKQQQLQQYEYQFQQKANTFIEKLENPELTDPEVFKKADALYDDGLISPGVLYHVVNSDMGAELTSYLVNNEVELAKLSAIQDPRQLQVAISRLEGRLESQPKPEPRTTKAPPPITQIKSKGSASTKDPAEMTQQEFERWFNGA